MVVGKDVDSKDQMVTRDQMDTGDNMDTKNEIEIQDEAEEAEEDFIPTTEEPIICSTFNTNKKVVEKKKVIIPKDALVDVKHRVSIFSSRIDLYMTLFQPVWTLDNKQRATLTRVGPSETTRQGRPERKMRIRKKVGCIARMWHSLICLLFS